MLLSLQGVVAQQGDPATDDMLPEQSQAGRDYAGQCWRQGVKCSPKYGDQNRVEPTASSKPDRTTGFEPPTLTGPLAIIIVLVTLIAIFGLWMRFGGGGVLLKSTPREANSRRGEAPTGWTSSAHGASQTNEQFLQAMAMLADRKQALIQLLQRCLLHMADQSQTRLFRSDTERAVFARLPATLAGRDQLRRLLVSTELTHYGGRPLDEDQFSELLALARDMLSKRGVHA